MPKMTNVRDRVHQPFRDSPIHNRALTDRQRNQLEAISTWLGLTVIVTFMVLMAAVYHAANGDTGALVLTAVVAVAFTAQCVILAWAIVKLYKGTQ